MPSHIATAADGAELAYVVDGAGPDLVLVHGITESRHSWDPLIPALAASHRVIRPDLRGHGESARQAPYDLLTMADDLAAVVAAAGAEAPAVVGHSLGGAVVTAYAAAGHPCRAVVNIDQALQLGGFKDALAPIEPMLRADDGSFRAAINMVFGLLDGALPPAERARLDASSSPEHEVVLGVWAAVFESPAEELDALAGSLLGAVSVPYLALHGIDPGPDYPGWLAARLPQAVFELWPDLGHYPHLVEPERFLNRLADFLTDPERLRS
jgi:pimeloyl-ACP methyl ester carboxylesterase